MSTNEELPKTEVDMSTLTLGLPRGTLVSVEDFKHLHFPGYEFYESPDGRRIFSIKSSSGAPSLRFWRGFVRRSEGKTFIFAIETNWE